MPSGLTNLAVRNYRCLADVRLDLNPLNVFFGPNGSGKSSLLDALWFVRDCAVLGVDTASAERNHGIGLLYDGAEESEGLSVTLGTETADYAVSCALSSGRMEPFAGENLYSKARKCALIKRTIGSDKAVFRMGTSRLMRVCPLREGRRLSLGVYLDLSARGSFSRSFSPSQPATARVLGRGDVQRLRRKGTAVGDEAVQVDQLLRSMNLFRSRSLEFSALQRRGSEASHEVRLGGRADNLWSVLRNLKGKRESDECYDAIMGFMKEAFPTFDYVEIEQTAPDVVYASFGDKGRQKPIGASGVSDGYLQLLILLTAIFSEGRNQQSLLLFDEPETSLHPWSLAVLARAMKRAARDWNRQILLATHSPALLSQFDAADIVVAQQVHARTALQRLAEMRELKDLLEQYDPGSLYMAQAVAGQGPVSQ